MACQLFYSKELRQRIESNQQREQAREQQRIAAMQRRREHREAIQQQREHAIEETVKRRNVRYLFINAFM